jgi:membrane fusion protein (multidrug efflux system)
MQRLDWTKRIAAGAVLTGILMMNGCGPQSGTGGRPPGGPPEVAVLTVQPQRLVVTTELTGRTSAHRVAEVRPQVGGLIQKRFFTEGADVQAGQPLFRIDPAPLQAALNNAKAALVRSEAGLSANRSRANRLQELLADKAVSAQDTDDAAAALKQMEADIQYNKAIIETAQINLGYTQITAPISGRIGRSNVTEGALVAAYQPVALVTIQQLDPMYVDVAQSTTELLQLRRRLEEGRLQRNGGSRNKVRLILEDNSRYPWEGALEFRDVTVDPSTGSVILRVTVPNPKGILLPGMFVRTVVEEGVNRQAILIPQEAVSRNPKGDPVALIVDKEGKVQERMLVLDRAIGNQWLVTSGLNVGDRLIVEGGLKVKPGISVKVVALETEKVSQVGNGKQAIPPAPKAK